MANVNVLFPHIPGPRITERVQIRRHLRVWLHKAFSLDRDDAYHGRRHHEMVAQLANATAQQVPELLSTLDYAILDAAVLLHDIGYSAFDASWSPNRHEHVQASIEIAISCLEAVPFFAQFPELITAVCFLIGRHDDTSYKFPTTVWQRNVGKIGLEKYEAMLSAFEVQLPNAEKQRLYLLLAIVREADALTAAGEGGAERTFLYSISRGLPIFAQGNPLNAWCWEESAIGNTRLAAKRALIDAFTVQGRENAQKSYQATEAYIAALCDREGVQYIPETLSAMVRSSAIVASPHGGLLEIMRYEDWSEFQHILRKSFNEAHRYGDASLTIRPVSVSGLQTPATGFTPLHGDWLKTLQSQFVSEYALSLFDLAGIIIFRWNNALYSLTTPVIMQGRVENSAQEIVVIDGLPSITLAQRLHVQEMWVVEVAPV